MFKAVLFSSPFDLSKREYFDVIEGQSIRDIISHNHIDLSSHAIVVALNGDELLESQWDYVVTSGDIVTLHFLPGAPVVAWVAANWLLVAYGVATALYLGSIQEPDLPGSGPDLKDASPTYSISSRGNAARLGAPKPVFYGKVRTWPDLSANSFTTYDVNTDQILFQLFEVRQGQAIINESDMRFEDTPLSNFTGYEVEVIQPGAQSTLFPGAMVTSTEFSQLEILTTMTAYVACDVGKKVVRIYVDIVAAAGIYERDQKSGNFKGYSVQYKVEAQEINNSNVPIGSWVTLGTHTMAGSNQNAIRRSHDYVVTAGRYQVRVVRLAAGSDDAKISDKMTWVGLRGLLEGDLPVTTTTRVALKIRASEQLGGKGLGRFNLISSGKIPTWHPSTGWSSPVETANPAWVFADIARNSIYGGDRADSFIDLAGLYSLASQLTSEGVRFDGGFDSATTVWEALTKVAAVARGVPVDRSGVYYLVRDVESPPSYMFTHANIVKDSFRINYTSVLEESADSVRAIYFDETDDYRQKSVFCYLPGSPTANPREVTLFGCTNHDRAYKWGMYLCAVNYYRRISVEFETGIEGYLPFFYDSILVSHYLIGRDSVAQVSGDVVAFDGVDIVTLSEKITGLATPYIVFRGLDGAPSSPYPITIIDDFRAQINTAFDNSVLVFDPGYERPHFMCGEGNDFSAKIKINNISPQGNGIYRISGFIDAPEVYDAEAGTTVPPINVLPPQVNLAPTIKNLTYALSGLIDLPTVTLSWTGENADYYLVEYSKDSGASWNPLGEGRFLSTSVEDQSAGITRYRVAGVNVLRGSWQTIIVDASESEYTLPLAVTGLALVEAFTKDFVSVTWASSYLNHHIKVKKSGSVYYEDDVAGLKFEISAATASRYSLGRTFDIEVYSVSSAGLRSATAPSLTVSNPAPAAVSGISVVGLYQSIDISFNADTSVDFAGYQVWMSTTSGFTPGAGNLLYDGTNNKLTTHKDAAGAAIPTTATTYYFRVAAYDKFGKTGLNISSEISVTTQNVLVGIAPGEITATLIASGAIDMTKFASGIRPPRVVSSLPTIDGTTYKNQDTVTLTTDGKLYRAVSGSWTADIPAVNISGQLTNAQLAAIDAAKVTGQLVNSQLADLAATKITGTLNDSQLAAISAAKVTGTLTGSQIGTGAIDMTKFASGIRPSRVVSSLPTIDGTTYKNQDTVTLTTDGKLYRAVSGSWTADIPAVNISGQLTNAQLAAIDAAKVTGQLANSQIADLAATKITGTLTDSQLAAISAAKVTGQITTTQITDNSISTAKIQANAITADKIIVRNANGTLNDSPDFADQSAWVLASGVTFGSSATSVGAVGNLFVTCAAGTDKLVSSSKLIPVSSAKTYYLSANLYAASGNDRPISINLDMYNASGSYVGFLQPYASAPATGVWSRCGGQVGAGTGLAIPTNVNQCKITMIFQVSSLGSTSLQQAAQDFRLEEVSGATLIQDGAIITNKIAAGAITTAKIAAGAITANEIASNAITAGKIAAGTITSNEIAANTITAADIAAGAITATELGAGSVTTAKVAAGAITANEIAANAITAAKISAGAIGATQIAANAITADKIFVQRFGTVLNDDPNFADATAWFFSNSSQGVETSGSGFYATTLVTSSSVDGAVISNKFIQISRFKTYYISTGIYITPTALRPIVLLFYWYDVNGSFISASYPYNSIPTQGVWNKIGVTVGAGTSWAIPTNATQCQIGIAFNSSGSGSGSVAQYAQDFRLEELLGGTLIKDGSITTDKIAANAITAGKIAAGTITSNEIAANTITAADIAAGAITATELGAGSVTTAKVAAGAITANEIASNAITAGKIAAGAITSNEIAANTITAADIAAGAITATELAAGSVTTAKVAAGAITANEIAANAITAAKISAGAVGATQIAANAITADKLFVPSFGTVLNDDPNFADATAWTFVNSSQGVETSGSGFYATTLVTSSSVDGAVISKKFIQISRFKTYYLSSGIYVTPTALRKTVLIVYFYDVNGSYITESYPYLAIPTQGSWNKIGVTIGAGTSISIPTNATQCKIGIAFNSSGSGSGSVAQYAQDFRLEELLGGTLIQDGSITTNKVAAGAITANEIASNTITTNKIVVGAASVAATSSTTGVTTFPSSSSTWIRTDSITSFTSTGANVVFQAAVYIICDGLGGTIDSALITLLLSVDGTDRASSAVFDTAKVVNISGSQTARFCLPLLWAESYSSGSHSYSIKTQVDFRNSSGTLTNTIGSFIVASRVVIQENKV